MAWTQVFIESPEPMTSPMNPMKQSLPVPALSPASPQKRSDHATQPTAPLAYALLLSLLFIAPTSPSASAASACAQPPAGLVGWWPGDGNAYDLQGSRHGMPQNGARFDPGKTGAAFQLDGDDDYIDLGGWSPGTSWTLEAWVNPSAKPAGRHTMVGGMNECRDWGLTLTDGQLGLTIKPPGICTGTLLDTNTTVATGNWYHVVGTCDGTNAWFYVNGVLRSSGSVETNYVPSTAGTRIGGGSCCTGESFPGLVDEVAIYNRALSASEVQTQFAVGDAGKCRPELTGPSEFARWSKNGHWYNAEVVGPAGITWTAAQAAAERAGGYLASLGSADENAFVFNLAKFSPDVWYSSNGSGYGPWLGGTQPAGSTEPAGGWKWVTGESFGYTSWSPAEPNNGGPGENSLHFYAVSAPMGPTWNDAPSDFLTRGYMVEFDTTPLPRIVSPTEVSAIAGRPFVHPFSALNHAFGFAATGLPAGLKLDPATGEISGTPSAPGTYSLTLQATNRMGTGSAGLRLTVQPSGYVAGNLLVTESLSLSESDFAHEWKNVTVSNCTLTLAGTHQFNTLTVISNGVVTHPATTGSTASSLSLVAANSLVVDGTSKIDVTGKGYPAGRTAGNTARGAAGRSGGSYAGFGQPDALANLNWTYGDFRNPQEPGSGGGTDLGGAAGGGLLRIVAGSVTLDGKLTANGASGFDYYNRAAGSGGGIRLETSRLSGTGTITADGGGGALDGGSGGGGRVALYYSDATGFVSTNISARGGISGRGAGAAGTVYLRTAAGDGTLRIDSQGSLTAMWTPLGKASDEKVDLTGENLVITGTNVVVKPEHQMPVIARNLSVTTGAVLMHQPTTALQEYSLTLSITGELAVDASARINVSGLGYAAGFTQGNTRAGGSTFRAGGSHGGLGYPNGAPNGSYGDFHNPNELGSGGGSDLGGGNGGGLLRITANTLSLDGLITANGKDGFDYYNRASGSGGSIWAQVETLKGKGTIRADGGEAYLDGGSGGGGRVAVYYTTASNFDLELVTAHGGTAGSGVGAVGTVYLKPRVGQGVLRIDNHGGISGSWTPLGIASDTSFDLGPDKLVISGTNIIAKPRHQMPVLAHDLTLQKEATLTHLATTADKVYSLTLSIPGALRVDASSRIDAVGLGYLPGTTQGNTNAGGTTFRAGGSHGGLGYPNGAPNGSYGNLRNPADAGAGGGPDLGNQASGGGVLRITTGSLTVDGLITADGQSGFDYYSRSGGAGGSIWITTDSLSGTGHIEANGGEAYLDGGSGGGGRIAVEYRSAGDFNLDFVTTHGGHSGSGFGAVGTVYLKPSTAQAVLRIDNHGGTSGSWTPLGIASDTAFDLGPDRLVISGTNVIAKPRHQMPVLAHDLAILNQASLTHLAATTNREYSIVLTVPGVLTVDAASRIDAIALGYLPGYTLGNTTTGATTYRAGGSHGGYGYPNGERNAVYGDYRDPNELGSGSGTDLSQGSGGGLVHITAGSLVLDGLITADGRSGFDYYNRAAGSGGSLWISVDSVSGSGLIRANGGNGYIDGGGGGGSGGGGRVALYYGTNKGFNFDKVLAHGGSGGSGSGAAGSIYLKDRNGEGILRFDSHGAPTGSWIPLGIGGLASFDSGNDRVVISGEGMVAKPEHQMPIVLRHLTLEKGAVLTHLPTTPQSEYSLQLTVLGTLTVDATSRIDVSTLGYVAGRTLGNVTAGASTSRAGGSYGGLGGHNGTPNTTYGDYRNPNELGSGGGPDLSSTTGGGLARITASSLVLDGVITADGQDGYGYYTRSAGSGGGVWISVEDIRGRGIIQANGGKGYSDGGSGGGGRVALYFTRNTDFDLDRINAHGGVNGDLTAAVGTVYVKAQGQRGLLRIDNHGNPSGSWTPLGIAGDEVFDASADVVAISGTNVVVKPAFNLPIRAYSLALAKASLLTHRPTTATEVFSLNLQVTDRLEADASSRIDVSSLGYTAGRTAGNSTEGAATGRAGGSHGGLGGTTGFGLPNAIYGDPRNPAEPGAGSGTDLGGCTGGGLARISAATFLLDGALRANGDTGSGYYLRPGGSGGGVLISAGRLLGQGTITANGGGGYSDGCSGGGGRVAIYTWQENAIPLTNITALGGQGGPRAGETGTVFYATSPLFFWDDPEQTLTHGVWPLQWSAFGVNPAGVAVDVTAFGGGLAYPILANQPFQGRADWDTTTVPDGTFQLRAVFRDARQEVIGEAVRTVTVLNAAQWHTGTVSGTETWAPGLAHVVQGNLRVGDKAVITLPAGVVVKFTPGSRITVLNGGKLEATGTTSAKVILTALTDDAAGGDDNLDGNKSHPQPGEWAGVGAEPGGTLTYNESVEFRYLRTEHSGAIAKSETWLGTFLHQITGDIVVPNGVTLTIEAGAVVKFGQGLGLSVESGGQLVARGGVALPITFTSLRDDAASGDTNADGDKTQPAAGDWHWILLNGGKADFDHCQLRYGGGPAEGGWGPSGGPGKASIKTSGSASLTFANSAMTDSFYDGILSWGGPVRVVNSVLTGIDRAICAHPGSVVEVVNCTLDDNRVGLLIHGGELRVTNTIVTGSYTAGILHDYGSDALSIRSSDIWNTNAVSGNYSGTADQTGRDGNFSADPGYKDSSRGNFRLRFLSPCVDAAHGPAAPATDSMGAPRYDDPRSANTGTAVAGGAFADLGAYELVETADSDLDLAVEWVDGPTEAQAGERVKVRWQVANIGTGKINGGWHDAISLIPDSVSRGVEKIAVREVASAGPLAPGERRVLEAEVRVPGGTQGPWRWQIDVNVQGEVFEGRNWQNNLSPLSAPTQLTVPELTLGTPARGQFTGINEPAWFVLHQDAGTDLLLTLDARATEARNRVYLGFDSMPTESSFDQRGTEWNSPDARLGIAASATARTVYVLVMPESNAGGLPDFELQVAKSVFTLSGLGIPGAGNAGSATVPLHGSGFTTALAVELRAATGPTVIRPQKIRLLDSANALATFDLTDAPLGVYHVAASQQGVASTLSNAFTVRRGLGGQLDVRLVMPERARLGRPFKAYVKFSNTGDADLPPTMLTIRNSAEVPMWLDQPAKTTLLQVVALSDSDEKLEFLRPGDAGSIRFNSSLTSGRVDYWVEWENARSTNKVDWAAAKAAAKPDGAPASWDALWDAMVRSVGNTEGAYINAAATAAAEAARSGLTLVGNAEVLQYLLGRQALAAKGSTVLGRAMSSDSLQPLGEENVLLRNVATGEDLVSQSWPDGRFSFADVPAGTYAVSLDGYAADGNFHVTVPTTATDVVADYPFHRGAGINGRIVNALDQSPIAGARVMIADPETLERTTVLSGADGSYAIHGLAAGSTAVEIEADGFIAPPVAEVVLQPDAPQTLSVELQEGGTIIGRVLTPTGAAASGANIQVTLDDQAARIAFADDAGNFRVSGLAAGSYTVWAARAGNGAGSAASITVAQGRTATANVTLTSRGRVSGVVTDRATGAPVPNASVMIEAFTTQQFYATDSSGRYQMDDVAPGTYRVMVVVTDYIPASKQAIVTAGGNTTLDFHPRKAGLIEGLVKANGSALPGATLVLSSTNALPIQQSSGADGGFRFADLPDGHYLLSALLPSGQSVGQQELVLDRNKNRYQTSFDLKPAQVRGRVLNATGQPVEKAKVSLALDGLTEHDAATDAFGRFSMLVAKPGTYQLSAAATSIGFIVRPNLALTAGATLDVPDLSPSGPTLTVQVRSTSAGSNVLAYAAVRVTPASAAGLAHLLDFTDVNGQVPLRFMAPGDYVVTASRTGMATLTRQVTLGTTAANLTLDLPLARVLRGRVIDHNGPVEDAILYAVDKVAQTMTSTHTDATGGFSFDALSQTEYDLWVVAQGRRPQAVNGVHPIGPSTLLPDVVLETTGIRLWGKVRNAQGLPLAGVSLTLLAPGGQMLDASTTDSLGEYLLPPLAAGPYVLHFGLTSTVDLEFPIAAVSDQQLDTVTLNVTATRVPAGSSLLGTSGIPDTEDDISWWHNCGFAAGGAIPFPTNVAWDTQKWREKWQADRTRYNASGKKCDNVLELFEACRFSQANILETQKGLRLAFLALRQLDSGVSLQTVNKGVLLSGKMIQLLIKLQGLTPDAGSLGGLVNTATATQDHDPAKAAQIMVKAYKDIEIFFKLGVDHAANLTELAIKGDLKQAKFVKKELKATVKALASLVDLVGKDYIGGATGHFASKKFFSTAFAIVTTFNDLLDYVEQLEKIEKDVGLGLRLYSTASFQYAGALRRHALNMEALSKAVDQCAGPKPPPLLPSDQNDTHNGTDSGAGQGSSVNPVGSIDPNDKLTVGFGKQGFVAADTVLIYTIRFENKTNATAPAQRVTVTDRLDPKLDWSTFELMSVGFNLVDVPFPPGLTRHTATTSVASDPANDVAIQAAFDPANGLIQWVIESVDPITEGPPEDPLAGFLPPNDILHHGEGYVMYGIRARADVPSGTVITNMARIVFDENPPIDTPMATNILDLIAPASAVEALPASSPRTFTVRWTGTDLTGDSGLKGFDVYVSRNGQPYALWLAGTADASKEFAGEPDTAYAFFSIATDSVGNREAAPSAADATTRTQADGPAQGPVLDYTYTANTITLSWPVTAAGFLLETATDIGPGAAWAPVQNPVLTLGGLNMVTHGLVGDHRFFRLRKP